MFSILSVLMGSTVTCWAVLWFVLPLDWQQSSPTVVLGMHLLPPLLLTLAYYGWQRRLAAQAGLAVRAREAAAEGERMRLRDAARQQHMAQLAARRLALSCRWLWVRCRAGEFVPDDLPGGDDAIYWYVDRELATPAGSDLLDGIETAACEALAALYRDLPGAASLPLLLQTVPQLSGIAHVKRARHWQQQAWQQANPARKQPSADCRFLSGHGALADRVQACLQQDPAMPGVVLLVADAPCLQADSEEGAPASRQQGLPGAALVLTVMLRKDLPQPLLTEAQQAAAADPYQPHWDRPAVVVAETGWGPVPEQDRAAFMRQALHVCLAPSCHGQLPPRGMLQLTRVLHPLVDDALVNASLLDYAFSPEEADPGLNRQQEVAWLVHNSGEQAQGGMRLAAIASNLSRQGIDLHPVDQASNIVRDWGDVGSAAGALLLAVAVMQAHRLQAPVMQAYFDLESVAIAVAYPAAAQEPT